MEALLKFLFQCTSRVIIKDLSSVTIHSCSKQEPSMLIYAFMTTTAQLFPLWIPVLVEQHAAVDKPREWWEFPIPSVEQIFVETMQEVLRSEHCESKPLTGRKNDQLASQMSDFIQLSHCLKVSLPPSPTFSYQKAFILICGRFVQSCAVILDRWC